MLACVLSHFSHVRLFVTLWTVAHQTPLSMGFTSQEYWSKLPCPLLGDDLDPAIEPASPEVPVLQTDSLPLSHQGSPNKFFTETFFPLFFIGSKFYDDDKNT